MIDTIGFKIPINRDSQEYLSAQMVMTQRKDKKTGQIQFEYHNSKLLFLCPSWRYDVAFKVGDEIWAYDEQARYSSKVTGFPHITLEYSVPKILMGNNLVSIDPCLIFASMHAVRDHFQELFKIVLPSPNDWHCYRVDTCANYVLENAEQVKSFISYLQRLDYPRKTKNSYGDSGVYLPSRQQTLKVYWKGPEFKKHDMERCGDKDEAYRHLLIAQTIVRVEVEHRRRLRYIVQKYEAESGERLNKFDGHPRVADLIEIVDFKEEHERVVSKMLCGTEPKVMRARDVYNVLRSRHSERQSRSFHHVYIVIVTQGQKEAKSIIPEGTYYRATRAFRELAISLIASEGTEEGIFLNHGFPADFSLEMGEGNPYYQKPLCECPVLHSKGKEEPF